MDNELNQLEAELARMRPAAPSRALLQRIGAELVPVAAKRTFTWIEWILAGALPAATIIVLVFTQVSRPGPAETRPNVITTSSPRDSARATSGLPLKPVAAEKLLVSADDEGLVTLSDGTRARRERLHFVDTITWKNPHTNASLTWSVPREEVRVVPVAFQ